MATNIDDYFEQRYGAHCLSPVKNAIVQFKYDKNIQSQNIDMQRRGRTGHGKTSFTTQPSIENVRQSFDYDRIREGLREKG